jgi:hypothetical protein
MIVSKSATSVVVIAHVNLLLAGWVLNDCFRGIITTTDGRFAFRCTQPTVLLVASCIAILFIGALFIGTLCLKYVFLILLVLFLILLLLLLVLTCTHLYSLWILLGILASTPHSSSFSLFSSTSLVAP